MAGADGDRTHSDRSVERAYYATRYTPDPARSTVWRHVCAYLQPWVDADGATVDLAAGYADFSNHIRSSRRVAIDANDSIEHHAGPGVEAIVGDASDLSGFGDAEFATVFASNFLEHLEHDTIHALLDDTVRVLRPGGRLLLVQPNFRIAPRRYFDDYTHRTIWTDRSLTDAVAAHGLDVVHVEARFLPLTMKSKLSFGHRLVPLYLRGPRAIGLTYRPLAGQMLVVAERR